MDRRVLANQTWHDVKRGSDFHDIQPRPGQRRERIPARARQPTRFEEFDRRCCGRRRIDGVSVARSAEAVRRAAERDCDASSARARRATRSRSTRPRAATSSIGRRSRTCMRNPRCGCSRSPISRRCGSMPRSFRINRANQESATRSRSASTRIRAASSTGRRFHLGRARSGDAYRESAHQPADIPTAN